MAKARFSRQAQRDIDAIDEFTVGTWGIEQADRYLDSLQAFCHLIAETPGIGRPWNKRRPQSRRIEHKSHVIFYRRTVNGILVTRVLHEKDACEIVECLDLIEKFQIERPNLCEGCIGEA